MDKKELDEGMKEAKGKESEKDKKRKEEEELDEEGKKEESESSDSEEGGKWEPSMDWLMDNVGPFFNNNAGLGELLLDKLKDSGIDTEGVALAGVVDVLQRFNQEYKALKEAVGDNLDRIDELSSQSEDLTKALKDLVKDMGVSTDLGDSGEAADAGLDAGAAPDMEAGVPPDMSGSMPPDMGAGVPPDMVGGMPPDMVGGMPPDMGAGAAPDMGGGYYDIGDYEPGLGSEVLSDYRYKTLFGATPSEFRGVVSDRRLKRAARRAVNRYRRSKGTRLSSDIIDSCSRGF